jgi:hypothetical protein
VRHSSVVPLSLQALFHQLARVERATSIFLHGIGVGANLVSIRDDLFGDCLSDAGNRHVERDRPTECANAVLYRPDLRR